MTSNLALIIKREYLERVSRKSFIISTILMPLLMIALMMLPTLILSITGPENKIVAVIDKSDAILPALQNDGNVKFEKYNSTIDAAKADENIECVMVIGEDVLEDPSNIQMYTREAASMQTVQFITMQIKGIVESYRLQKYNIENLPQILNEVNADVNISTYRLDRDETSETSTMVAFSIGIMMAFILYMFLMIYGQMVMNSIIEEKNNRVLEIVVSSVKPRLLMLGKIIGIGLVALTQVLIWGVLICSASRWIMPLVKNSMGAGVDMDLLSAVNQLGDTGYIISIFGWMALLLIGGYLFYSTFFAAIGSAVDNVQDASQFTMLPLLPIILGLIFAMSAASDPNSTMSFWLSMIPFTSPMVMIARIPFGIPTWEIALSVLILAVSFLAMVWVSAKIYRIGIFMYGKKPTFKELIRWSRYK